MMSPRTPARLLALTLGLGLASGALGAAVPASARPAAAPSAPAASSSARYAGSVKETVNSKAFLDSVLKTVAAKRAAQPGSTQAVTLHYDASQAPSFRSQIASAASIWNSSESNVKLQEASGNADFSYREGNDPQGSHASTDGHGGGSVFLDYTQIKQNDPVRVVTHETGHILGLPDHYSGPCSELMSGGGPGPSCTNRYPDATERAKVDQIWASGSTRAPGAAAQPPADPSAAQPAQPAQPVQPAQPAQPAQPVQPVQPAQPAQPVQPVQPVTPGGPMGPGGSRWPNWRVAPGQAPAGPLYCGAVSR
ncbi:snapalysin [Streptomyces sp. NPDC058459]|uniref:snapalysin n=1 Tax=Streptomyces sp. NPDC058459 TaxID=3346508 RepID=UPI00365328F3